MKKRGQVSIFIVIGALLLVAATVYLYVDNRREEVLPGVFVSIEEIPQELQPVNNFITQCIDDVGTRALKLVGEHGGYVSLDDPSLSGQRFNINENPTESDAVVFAEESNLKIPYWWYLESPNDCEGSCVFTTKRPPLRSEDTSIEKQINRFFDNELQNCFNDFQDVKSQGFAVEELGDFSVDTRIAENDVVIILNYPLRLSKGDIQADAEQFFVRLPVDLETMYNLATEITNLQQEYRFLEKQTMNLVASFAQLDETRLPPLAEMRFEYGTNKRWIKSEVKENVQDVLTYYIPIFQVDGSSNFNRAFHDSQLKQSMYDGMIIPGSDEYGPYDVTFSYLDFWPLYFDLNCNGEICEPESISSNFFSFLGIQRYNFAYDVSFPTLVEIYDPEALHGRGFKFNFFLEGNVRNNREMPSEFRPLSASVVPQFSGLCDLTNRNSKNVSVSVLDSIANTPLSDVSVTVSVTGESCYIGETNASGILEAQFPTGTVGAVVNLLKKDYITKATLFDAKLDEKTAFMESLAPINTKKIIVKKKLVEKTGTGWTFTNRVADLDFNEQAVVTLTRISPLDESEYSTFANLKGSEQKQIKIAPGEYELDISLLLREHINIPSQKYNLSAGFFFSDEEITLPGYEFNEQSPFPSGGANLRIKITEEDLKKDTIVLYAVSPALQFIPESERTILDLEQTTQIDYYSQIFAPLLRPTFQ